MRHLRQLLAMTALAGTFCLGSSFALGAEPPNDLVLKGDAKCTGCHDEVDDAKPTMLDLHPSVLSIGKTF